MNLENIEKLINEENLRNIIIKILEYEQSKLHLNKIPYKVDFDKIIEEFVNNGN